MGLYILNSFASIENNHPYPDSMPDRGQVKVIGFFQQIVSFVFLSSHHLVVNSCCHLI